MHHYFDHKNNSGSEIIKISSVENQTHINIIRDRKSIGRHQIPLFFKLYGSGLDLDKFAENPSLSLQIAKLVRSPFLLKVHAYWKTNAEQKFSSRIQPNRAYLFVESRLQ